MNNTETFLDTSGNASGLFETEMEFIAALAANRPSDNRSLLLSSEFIFHGILKEKLALERALQHGFDRVKVLLFIRDPVGDAASHWQQLVKGNSLNRVSLESYFCVFSTPEGVKAIVDQMNRSEGVALTVLNYSRCKDRLLEEPLRFVFMPIAAAIDAIPWFALSFYALRLYRSRSERKAAANAIRASATLGSPPAATP